MAGFLVFLALTVLAGIPVLLGWTPDTRDRQWSVGALIGDGTQPQTTGWTGGAR